MKEITRNLNKNNTCIDRTELKGTLYSYTSENNIFNLNNETNEGEGYYKLPNGLVLKEKKKMLYYLISPVKQNNGKQKKLSTMALLSSVRNLHNRVVEKKYRVKTNELSKCTTRSYTKENTVIPTHQLFPKEKTDYIEDSHFKEVKVIHKGKNRLRNKTIITTCKDKQNVVPHVYSLSSLKRLISMNVSCK